MSHTQTKTRAGITCARKKSGQITPSDTMEQLCRCPCPSCDGFTGWVSYSQKIRWKALQEDKVEGHPWTCSSPATTTTSLILQGEINNVKIKAKAKLFRADSRREGKMLLSFFHMRRVTKGDLHAHPSGCCLDLPARSH